MNTPVTLYELGKHQSWFDAIFIINLAKRFDRWEQAKAEAKLCGWTPDEYACKFPVYRFDAYSGLIDHNGNPNGNIGCTSSHRGVLELIAFHRYERALVLEDDFMLRPAIAKDFPQLFDAVTRELPDDWKMLYLGGSYGENPKRRHSPHLIETNSVMTTSSYVIGWRQARHMAPHISGIGPIDSLYHRFNREPGCFMAYPRLFVQRPSYSDLTERMAENVTSMEDSAHEDKLLEGTWLTMPRAEGSAKFPGQLRGTVQRREISEANQLDGTEVIVDGRTYIVASVALPTHSAPWFRGQPCVYTLRLP